MCSSRMVSVDLWTSCLQGATFSVRKSAMTDCLNISGGGDHLLVKTNELRMGIDGVQGAVDHVH